MKTIKAHADLAINSAPPVFDEPLHVGRSNIGSREDFLKRVNQILDNRWRRYLPISRTKYAASLQVAR